MNWKIFIRFFLFAVAFNMINSCAKMSTPSGGKKDIKPPVLMSTMPEKGAKNFKEEEIICTFNEYVVLDNINDKFMVSPPMKIKPRIYIKGKSVITEFAEDLRDSTTYTLNFQDAIKDLNEGNKIDNFQFVFSTGPVIDSLSVTGNVYTALNLEIPEKTLVLMYKELADSAVEKHIPDYISRVDPTGYFRIDNVRPGKYRLYALKDNDNSKNYNLMEEEFAFLNNSIEVTAEKNFIIIVKDTATVKKEEIKEVPSKAKDKSATKAPLKKVTELPLLKGEYPLYLFSAQKKSHYLTSSSRPDKNVLLYTLSLPPDSMKFEFSIPGAKEDSYLLERSRNNDTLKVWLIDSTLYSNTPVISVLKYPQTDTLGIEGYKTDSIKMRFTFPTRPRRAAKATKQSYKVETNLASGSLKPGSKIVITSKTPLKEPDSSRIRIYDATDKVRKTVSYSIFKDSANSCRYFINATLLPGKRYIYIADSAAYKDVYKEYTDSTGLNFAVRDPESYSKLSLLINKCDTARIIQLLSNTEKLIIEERITNSRKIIFPMLEVGIYRVRAIYDLNGDGKWTTGDFSSGRQPEPVSYYTGEIEIKANWQVENDWNMKAVNFKDQKLTKKPAAK
jgi:hypothetical protein